MRFKEKLDSILWALIMGLPIIAYLIMCINGTPDITNTINQFINQNIFAPIQDTMAQAGLYIPNNLFLLGIWIAYAYLVHIIVDVILFVPKIGIKLVKGFMEGKE